MKKILLTLILFGLLMSISAQELQHQTGALNIEVPVRVFKGDTFMDDLTIDDFELYENGILQKIEAVYLIRKTDIKREEKRSEPDETQRIISPQVSRRFVLLFDIIDYLPKVEDAIDYFFENVIASGDSLIVVTPVKAYNLKDKSWELKKKIEISRQLKSLLRKDVVMGNSEYRNTIKHLESNVLSISGIRTLETGVISQEDELDYQLERYQADLKKIEDLRVVNQTKMIQFSEFLKNLEGQKHVFLFHQKEFLPRISPKILNTYQSQFQARQDLLFKLNDLFAVYRRDINLNVDLIKQAYSDSSIAVHFLFITKLPEQKAGVWYHEQSEDVFSAFRELAHATGGLSESSANAAFAFKKAAEASENYYLLYYSPKDYKSDGTFKNIKVIVKGKSYRVMHRAGYVAD